MAETVTPASTATLGPPTLKVLVVPDGATTKVFSEKTLPSSYAPPNRVIPKSVDPLAVKSLTGFQPFGSSNETRVVGVPPVTGMLKRVPCGRLSRLVGHPKKC